MIRTVYYENMMINAKFFDFYFHMKTNIDQIQHMFSLKTDQNFDRKNMHDQFQNRLKLRVHKIDFDFRIQQRFDLNLIFQNCSNTKTRTRISKKFFFFMLIFKFRTDSLIICFSNNFFVNSLCAAETYAINFFKINVIFAFFIFFISSSLFSVDFQKFVNFDRKKILNLRILNETTKSIFSAIFCNEKTSNFVIITIIFFFFDFRNVFHFHIMLRFFRCVFYRNKFSFFRSYRFRMRHDFFFSICLFRIFFIIFLFFFDLFFFEAWTTTTKNVTISIFDI